MSLRTWLIKLLGGEPRLSAEEGPTQMGRRPAGDRVITTTATIEASEEEVPADEEEVGSLSLTTEMDELLYITNGAVTHFDLSGKGVSIVYTAGQLRVTDTLSSTIFVGTSGPGEELLRLPVTDKDVYDIFFNEASANLIIAGKPAADPTDDCKLYLFPINDRRVSISRNKKALVVREA